MSLRTVCFTGHRDMPPATSPEYRQIVRDTQYAITQVIGQGATVFYPAALRAMICCAGR